MASLLHDREEVVGGFDEDSQRAIPVPNWDSLFYGRAITTGATVSIGPSSGDPLTVQSRSDLSEELSPLQVNFQGLEIVFPTLPSVQQKVPSMLRLESKIVPVIQWQSLGPGLPASNQIAELWDRVALTDEESRAVKALNLIYSEIVERVAIIGDDPGTRTGIGRRPVVKLRDEPRPVPLKSLGDGAVRLFGVALALANSKDGFLLIDEAENGIHHSIQRDFWTMVLKAAHQNNVQVLATTHSWDCVAGFALASTEIEEVDGALVRLEKKGDDIRAVEYPSYDLDVIARQGIEVR